MYSSSFVADGTLAELVADSLRLLERERPQEFGALTELLHGRTLEIHVDDEQFRVSFRHGDARCRISKGAASREIPGSEACVTLRLSRRLIYDIVRAETSLVEAVRADRLEVIGRVEDVALVHDGLLLYVHGGTRARSFPSLWKRFVDAGVGDPQGHGGARDEDR